MGREKAAGKQRRGIILGGAIAAAALVACGGSGEPKGTREGLRNTSGAEIRGERELAFSRATKNERFPDLYLMNADGSQRTMLTDSPRAADIEPAWSPDGNRIAFVRWDGRSSDIYVINADGSGERRLTDTPGTGETGPAWSPDGDRIAFGSGGPPSGIYLMNPDGTDETRLPGPSDAGPPAWSPDGKRTPSLARAEISS